jgi:hypothetical protein
LFYAAPCKVDINESLRGNFWRFMRQFYNYSRSYKAILKKKEVANDEKRRKFKHVFNFIPCGIGIAFTAKLYGYSMFVLGVYYVVKKKK